MKVGQFNILYPGDKRVFILVSRRRPDESWWCVGLMSPGRVVGWFFCGRHVAYLGPVLFLSSAARAPA